jgi:hypothetical protein
MNITTDPYKAVTIDIYCRQLKRQFHYCLDRVPPWNVGEHTILLSGKGWQEGATVSILDTAFLYIKEWRY